MGDGTVEVGETTAVKWKNKFYDAVILTIGLYIFVIVDVHDFIAVYLTGSKQEVTNAEEELLELFQVLQYI